MVKKFKCSKDLPEILNLLCIGILLLIFYGCNNSNKQVKDKIYTSPANAKDLKEVNNVKPDSGNSDPVWTNPGQAKLIGKWQRSDADYILEISSAGPDGKLEAIYLNPNPINVEKAEWAKRDSRLFVNIVLRDVNYPGSIYTLQYSSLNDFLIGDYFQAIEGKNYDVLFLRKK